MSVSQRRHSVLPVLAPGTEACNLDGIEPLKMRVPSEGSQRTVEVHATAFSSDLRAHVIRKAADAAANTFQTSLTREKCSRQRMEHRECNGSHSLRTFASLEESARATNTFMNPSIALL